MKFEQDLSPQGTCRVVQCQMSERSLEHRQRDVYETHKHRTYAVAFYMVGNEIEAEEVTQDAFVEAFRQSEEPDGRCVDCSLVNELRQRMPLDEQAEPAEPVPGHSLGGRNVKRTEMEEALKELPPTSAWSSCCATSKATMRTVSPLCSKSRASRSSAPCSPPAYASAQRSLL